MSEQFEYRGYSSSEMREHLAKAMRGEDSTVRIIEMIMRETGTYDDMYMRPYVGHTDYETIGKFDEATRGGTHVNKVALSRIGFDLMKPQSAPGQKVRIANGWGEKRFSFVIKAQVTDASRDFDVVQVITGYTSHVAISRSDDFAPEMEFYFNSSAFLNSTNIHTATGLRQSTTVRDTYHVMARDQGVIPSISSARESSYLMRPEDVVQHMSMKDLRRVQGGVVSTLSQVGLKAKTSARGHGLPGGYISSLINTLNNETDRPDAISECSEEAIERTVARVSDPSIKADNFMSKLSRETGFDRHGYVTWAEMQRSFPEIFDRTHTHMMAQVRREYDRNRDPSRGGSEKWDSSEPECIAATVMANALPAIMMELMVSRIRFIATNRCIGGKLYVAVSDLRPIPGVNIDLRSYGQMFEQRAEQEVFHSISCNGRMDIWVEADVAIDGASFYSISLNGEPVIEYQAPTYSDGRFCSVLADGTDAMDDLSDRMTSLFEHVRNSIEPQSKNFRDQIETDHREFRGSATERHDNNSRDSRRDSRYSGDKYDIGNSVL